MKKKQKKLLIRIIIAGVFLVVLKFIPVSGWVCFTCYLVPYFIIGADILIKAWKGIIGGQVFSENFLMAVATIGAFALAILEKNDDFAEAVAVMLFYQVGEWFQSYAVGKSRKNITELMDIRPDYANIEDENGEFIKTDPDDVGVGTIIVVQPGEKVPIDGVVAEGESTLNTSALTGESRPRSISEGEEIISGCINMTGVLKIKTTKEFGESTVSKILDLVENASSRKSSQEEFIVKFARIYTPVVCFCALALAVLPPLFTMLFLSGPAPWYTWIYRALTFLVISCPCALVISIPLSFFGGIGGASREGILIKGSNYLEMLSKTGCVVFDKTGTLTKGVFVVKAVHHSPFDEAKLLEFAALIECGSIHPIAKSIKIAYGKTIDHSRVSDIKELSGKGITAIVDGIPMAAGNDKLMDSLNVKTVSCHDVGTIVHIAIGGMYSGHIVISDVVKEDAADAIKALKAAGVKETVMLTGDNEDIAAAVSLELGLDFHYSQLLPADKVEKVEKLITENEYKGSLAFVGDGINDAPVLSRADIGIAMGALGSDAAIEAADIVLMDDDPMKISKAIRISRKCLRIVYENIYFAIGIKLICLGLSAFGITNMWIAIMADVGVMILAVFNAIRALFVRRV